MRVIFNVAPGASTVSCALFVILLVVPEQVQSVSFDYDDDEGGGVKLTSRMMTKHGHGGWCYLLHHCRESSPHSDWQTGTCKNGKRQSPIDIKTDNLAPVRRKKRRVTLRRHKPKGMKRTYPGGGVPVSTVYSPPLQPVLSSSEEAEDSDSESNSNSDEDIEGIHGGSIISEEVIGGDPIIPSFRRPVVRPRQQKLDVLDHKLQVPSTVEQGLLCSPQPHWNVIWVNGKPYRYWIQMHLCRLILRQRAKFILEPAKRKKKRRPKTTPKPKPVSSSSFGSGSPTPSPSPPSSPATPPPTPSTTPPPPSTTTSPPPPPSTKPPLTPSPKRPSTTPTTKPTTTRTSRPSSTKSNEALQQRALSMRPKSHSTPPPTPKSTPTKHRNTGSPPIKLDFSEPRKNYVMKQFQLWNNGHTIHLSKFVPETGFPPTFRWPDQQDGVYKLEQIHFHWGPRDDLGSEHTVDGKAYSAEMHMVHYRSDEGNNGFKDVKSALESGMGNAIAVIGVFLQVDDSVTETFLQPHIYNFASVPRKGDKMTVLCDKSRLKLDQVLERVTEAYHYMGSFTTPAECNEIAAWIVCKKPIPIARKDIQALRSSVREGDYPLIMNYRSVQNNSQPVSLIGIKQK